MGEADIRRMLTDIMTGTRPGASSTTWYSPQRYLRPLNRWLLQFEEWQLIAAVVVISCVVLGSIVLLTTWCMGEDTAGRVEDVAERAKAVAGRAERELKEVAESGVAAAKRLAKSIDRVAEKVVGDGAANEMKASAVRKDEAEDDEEEEHDSNGPVQRKGKNGKK